VLVAQRLDPEKDTTTAVRAWARSGLGEEGWTLDLAGAGSELDAIRSLVAELGVASSVRLLGRVDDLADRMARASILLATAPAEPFGLTVTEAMAARLPIVAADGGGHHELLAPAAPEQLVAAGDVDAFAAALEHLAADEEARRRLGAANRRRYESAYTLERHVDRLDEVYARLVPARERSAS
jgi:glycosyltransferase involved in cell wall biosynthesis